MSVLDRIVDDTRDEVKRRRKEISLKKLEKQLGGRAEGFRPFSEALTRPGVSLIAEHKRRSPSAGKIRKGSKVAEVVQAYERGGAAALSVLTEPFTSAARSTTCARRAPRATLPVLRKDFIVDPYQLYEAAAAGADAILLIVAALDDKDLAELLHEAAALDLDALVEVHDERELERALEVGADVIGINNRDLSDFSVDIERTYELLADVPAGKTVVSESGFSTREQLDELERVGVDAVLVGETLMRAQDIEAAVPRAHRRRRAAMTRVKVCGDHAARGRRAGDRARRLGARVHPLAAVQAPRRPGRGRGDHPRGAAQGRDRRRVRQPAARRGRRRASTSSASRTCSCTATRGRRSAPRSLSARARR